jgi:glycosyltransferase involved in cell wall biosynthesis
MKPIVIIPAFNPPESFKILISRIHKIAPIPIIVVDDGSDSFVNIKYDYLIILRNINNKGKGYSLNKAFNYAYEQGYTHSITLDADSQHDPRLLCDFLEINEDISVVIGMREFNNRMPIHRKISNVISSKIISYICGQNIYDSQCGYRRYKLSDVCSENYIENGFQFESEVLIKLLGRGNSTIYHLKIPTIYEIETSYINNLIDTIKFIRLILRSIIT